MAVVEIVESGQVVEVGSSTYTVELPARRETEVSVITGIIDGGRYDGPYTAIPTRQMQTFQTIGKKMADNFTVEEIPYYKTSNPAGGYTAIIGG